MLRFVSGDLLTARESYLAQGVAEHNQEGLGTGLAFKISSRWPEVQTKFKKFARLGRFTAGEMFVVEPDATTPGFIYLATQPDMYHAKLSYLRKALKNLAKWSEENCIDSVALPKIGAGLGKLDWQTEVKPLFVEYLDGSVCCFVVYEDFVLARDSE
ncbi:hypothetical protein BH11CYA1_BH11CYA1_43940 [soil metagenome]